MPVKVQPQRNTGYGTPSGLQVAPINPVVANRAPTSADTGWPLGQTWVYEAGGSSYTLTTVAAGVATWVATGGGTTAIATINNNAPIAGNYTLAGTANQISKAETAGTTTFSLPAAITAPGSLTTTTSLTATTTVTAGTGITSTTGNIAATAGNVTAGAAMSATTTVTAGTGITSTTGNIVATAGAVNAGTSMTATAGDITATLGNVIIDGAAKQLRVHGGAATDFIGTTTLVNGVSPDIANTNIAATDQIFIVRTAKNASTAYGTYDYVITPSTKFVITASKADTTTEVADQSTVAYFIVRQV